MSTVVRRKKKKVKKVAKKTIVKPEVPETYHSTGTEGPAEFEDLFKVIDESWHPYLEWILPLSTKEIRTILEYEGSLIGLELIPEGLVEDKNKLIKELIPVVKTRHDTVEPITDLETDVREYYSFLKMKEVTHTPNPFDVKDQVNDGIQLTVSPVLREVHYQMPESFSNPGIGILCGSMLSIDRLMNKLISGERKFQDRYGERAFWLVANKLIGLGAEVIDMLEPIKEEDSKTPEKDITTQAAE